MSKTIIFRELPETFPEQDKYKNPSLVTSLVAHVALVAALLAIPFLLIDKIPQFQLLTMLVAPPPPPPAAPSAPLQVGVARPAAPRPVIVARPPAEALIMPTVVPAEIARIIDLPESSDGVIDGVPGGLPGGVAGGVLGSLLARNILLEAPAPAAAPPPPPPPPKVTVTAPLEPIRVGGDVKEPRITKLVPPKYPALASKARVHGTVVLEATLMEDGSVEAIRVVSGHPLLIDAAVDCVRQWRYEPTLLNGQPVAVILTAKVTFNQGPISD